MKKVIALAIIAASILLTGCWDLREVEKLGLITTIGIDSAENDQIKLVLLELSEQKQTPGESNGGAGKQPIELLEAIAPTIAEAMEVINASDYHRTYFAHTTAIILSEEVVSRQGIRNFIDFFERTPEIRRNTWLLISKEGQFNKIFSPDANLEEGSNIGKVIKGIIKNRSKIAFLSANTLGDFLNNYWETGSEPYVAGVSIIEPDSGNGNPSGRTVSSSFNHLDIESTAIFKNDKLAGWMDNSESRGLLWVKGNIKGGNLPIQLNNKKIVIGIIKMKSKIKPVIKDKKLQVDILIDVFSNLDESQVKMDVSDPRVLTSMADLQAKEIKKQILMAFNKSKSLDSDVLGFGNYLYGKYPREWKLMQLKKYDYYQNIILNVDIKSTVNQIGLIRKVSEIKDF